MKHSKQNAFVKSTVLTTLIAFVLVGCSGGKNSADEDTPFVSPGTDRTLSQRITPPPATPPVPNTGNEDPDPNTDPDPDADATADATDAKLDEILGRLNGIENGVDDNNDDIKKNRNWLIWGGLGLAVAGGLGLFFATKHTNKKLDKKTDEIKAAQKVTDGKVDANGGRITNLEGATAAMGATFGASLVELGNGIDGNRQEMRSGFSQQGEVLSNHGEQLGTLEAGQSQLRSRVDAAQSAILADGSTTRDKLESEFADAATQVEAFQTGIIADNEVTRTSIARDGDAIRDSIASSQEAILRAVQDGKLEITQALSLMSAASDRGSEEISSLNAAEQPLGPPAPTSTGEPAIFIEDLP